MTRTGLFVLVLSLSVLVFSVLFFSSFSSFFIIESPSSPPGQLPALDMLTPMTLLDGAATRYLPESLHLVLR